MEGPVGEKRPTVAIATARLANEQRQPPQLLLRESTCGRVWQCGDEFIETRSAHGNRAFEGGDRFAHVHEGLGQRMLVRGLHVGPYFGIRSCLRWKASFVLHRRQRAEDRYVSGGEIRATGQAIGMRSGLASPTDTGSDLPSIGTADIV